MLFDSLYIDNNFSSLFLVFNNLLAVFKLLASTSLIVSNLGTFRTPGIYHNLANLGTSSGLATFGEITEVNGKYMMNLGITLDERIEDGFYFCRALKAIEYLFAHPELMMEGAAKPFEIPDNIHKKSEKKKSR